MGYLNGEAIFQQDDLHVFSQVCQLPVIRDKRCRSMGERRGDMQCICRSQAILSAQTCSLMSNVAGYVADRQIRKMGQDFFIVPHNVATLQLPGAHRHFHKCKDRNDGCQMPGFDASEQGLCERQIGRMTFDVINQNAAIQPNV